HHHTQPSFPTRRSSDLLLAWIDDPVAARLSVGGIAVAGRGIAVAVAGRGIAVAGRGIAVAGRGIAVAGRGITVAGRGITVAVVGDRKSTRLNSSHVKIS